MTDEQAQDMDDVKIRLSKEEIPVDDETVYKSEEEEPDVVGELRNLGRQFGETMRTAWNSEERREFEREIREGVQTFAQEVDKAFKDVAASEPAQKAKSEAEAAGDKSTAEIARQKAATAVKKVKVAAAMAAAEGRVVPTEIVTKAEAALDDATTAVVSKT